MPGGILLFSRGLNHHDHRREGGRAPAGQRAVISKEVSCMILKKKRPVSSSPVISPAPKCSSGTVTVCPRGVGFNQKHYTAALHLSQNVFHDTAWRISRLTRVLPRPSFGQEGGAFTHADGRRRRKKEGRGIFPRSHNGMDDDCSGGGRGRRRAEWEETIVLQLGRGGVVLSFLPCVCSAKEGAAALHQSILSYERRTWEKRTIK